MENDRQLPAYINISRPTRDDGVPTINITIRDERSRSTILSIDIAPAELMLALTGSSTPVVATWTYLERMGKWMQSKTELVEVPSKRCYQGDYPPDKCAEIAKPYEIDGWKAKLSDLNNHLRRIRENVQSVRFFRWVDDPSQTHASS